MRYIGIMSVEQSSSSGSSAKSNRRKQTDSLKMTGTVMEMSVKLLYVVVYLSSIRSFSIDFKLRSFVFVLYSRHIKEAAGFFKIRIGYNAPRAHLYLSFILSYPKWTYGFYRPRVLYSTNNTSGFQYWNMKCREYSSWCQYNVTGDAECYAALGYCFLMWMHKLHIYSWKIIQKEYYTPLQHLFSLHLRWIFHNLSRQTILAAPGLFNKLSVRKGLTVYRYVTIMNKYRLFLSPCAVKNIYI